MIRSSADSRADPYAVRIPAVSERLIERVAVGAPVASCVVGGWRLTRTQHDPDLRLGAHGHARANLVYVLSGSYEETIDRSSYTCSTRSVLVKPVGAVHVNRYGTTGAECLIIEPPSGELLGNLSTIFESVTHLQDPAISLLGLELAAEVHQPDVSSQLRIESLSIELVARAARASLYERSSAPLVRRILDFVHEHFREELTLTQVATAVDRHPTHIVRAFRQARQCTIGTYVRRLRLESAAAELLTTDAAISQVAHNAGFYDHPHFCRLFKAQFGLSPAEYRRQGKAGSLSALN